MSKKEKVVKDTAERWLLTYADLMNLLLIFFIILYAMSQVDQKKFDALATALNQAFYPLEGRGPLPFDDKTNPIEKKGDPTTGQTSGEEKKIDDSTENKKMEIFKDKVEERLKEMGLQDIVTVKQQERGVQISIPSHVLFKPGSDEIENYVLADIENIGKVLDSLPNNQIRIEGHTDSDPINTPKFSSNWELSASRSVKVLKFFVEKNKIDPHRISATGYGEMWPIVPNTSEENKSRNRRVDIVILKAMFDKTSPEKLEK